MIWVWTVLGLLFVVWALAFHLHTRNHYARLVTKDEIE